MTVPLSRGDVVVCTNVECMAGTRILGRFNRYNRMSGDLAYVYADKILHPGNHERSIELLNASIRDGFDLFVDVPNIVRIKKGG